ncbi:MAG: hypothetical protein U0176_00185 [Bacteroidia bacterium]
MVPFLYVAHRNGLFAHPSESRWQLLDRETTIWKFERQPVFFPEYFKLGCYDYSPKKSVITNTGTPFRIALNVANPESIKANVSFYPEDNEQVQSIKTELKYMPWGVILTCTLPIDARGTLYVLAGHADSYFTTSVLMYGVQPAQPAI